MLQEKERQLRDILKDMGSCLVAFSGGVDSTYLLWIAHQELGSSALAVTAVSPSYPTHQRQIALDLVHTYGFRHEIVTTREMEEHLGVPVPAPSPLPIRTVRFGT